MHAFVKSECLACLQEIESLKRACSEKDELVLALQSRAKKTRTTFEMVMKGMDLLRKRIDELDP